MRRPSDWQHHFGPVSSPVTIAGSSSRTTGLVRAIRALGSPDSPKCVIVEGGGGSGKTLAASAFQAGCQEEGTPSLLVNEGTDPGTAMRHLNAVDALVVDDL